jgi:hypothetical protein
MNGCTVNAAWWMAAKGAAAGLALMLAVAPEADAFDGERHGFSLELGVGGGSVPVERSENLDWTQQSVRAQASPMTRFRAGWGIGSRLMLQYVNDVWWTTTDYGGNINSFYTVGVNGIGGTYFLGETAPAASLEAGVGIASGEANSTGRGSGLAVWGGVGFEPWKGWLARLTISSNGAADDMAAFGPNAKRETTTAGLTFSRAWY